MASKLVLFVFVVAVTSLTVGLAHAQDPFAGRVGASVLVSTRGDVGGAVHSDLWFAADVFRVGGFLGAGVVPAEEDARNRVYMPVGASLALITEGGPLGIGATVRGGLWAGATQAEKLAIGGCIGGSLDFTISLGAGAALTLGLDVWGLFGSGASLLFAPAVGFTWGPAPASPTGVDGE